MKIIIENAGAQLGYLLLENQGKLEIKASGVANDHHITALTSIPLENVLPILENSPGNLIYQADQVLYFAKERARNQAVIIYPG